MFALHLQEYKLVGEEFGKMHDNRQVHPVESGHNCGQSDPIRFDYDH